jgi:putative transcriptional regulator
MLDNMSSVLYVRRMGLTGHVRNQLRRYRLGANGMTQADLADRVGVTRQTIHSIETGKYNPSIELALRLALALQLAVEDLFQLDDQEKPS